MEKIFQSSKFDKTEKLIKILKSLNITEKDFLGSGCTAVVFKKNNQAIKVCRTDIRYFSNYRGNAESFKTQINSLNGICLPINEILYQDSFFFIYSQDLCQPLRSKEITTEITIEFLELFRSMIRKKIMISGLSPFNLCFYQEKLVIFDYHGLHPLKKLNSGRIARNLVKYVSLVYCPCKYHDYKAIMSDFNEDTVNQLTKMPSSLIDLLKLMLKKNFSLNEILHQIDKCIKQLDESKN